MEIHKLHEMLTEAGIEHCFLDRTPPGYNEIEELTILSERTNLNWGWQVLLLDSKEESLCSAIEGYGTYGFGMHGEQGDLIEFWDFESDPKGWLTAEEVFRRIKEAVDGLD